MIRPQYLARTLGVALFAVAAAMAGHAPATAQTSQPSSPPSPPSDWTREFPRTDFSRSLVDFGEIFSGGPPRDGIPAIDAPRHAPIAEALRGLDPDEPVMSLAIGAEAKAWPLRILLWHEIVNDRVGGVPVAVTFCPLCNSGVVFERVVDGAETSFGTTGRLRNSDLVMYDRATESWWQQYEGRAILGARAGDTLRRLPARLETAAEFAARHPDGVALAPPDPPMRDYGRNPYVGYDGAAWPFLYRGDYDGPGRPLMRVVAVEGRAEAWSFDLLRAKGRVESGDLRIDWRPGQRSALDAARVAQGRDIGGVIVRRRGADGAWADAPHDAPFAFAFRAFNPGAPIHHVE